MHICLVWRSDVDARTHVSYIHDCLFFFFLWKNIIYNTILNNNGIRLIGLVGFRVTRLLGHGPQLLRGLCPVHVLGGGGRTCCLECT